MDTTLPKLITVDLNGTPAVIPVTEQYTLYVIAGTGTLNANYAITASGTPYEGLRAEFWYLANITVSTFNITILGQVLTANQSLLNQQVTAIYHGSTWHVDVSPFFNQTGFIAGTMVQDGTLGNAKLTNSAITINGTSVALGATRTLSLPSADFANQGTTTTLLHGNAAGNPTFGQVINADVSASAGISFSKMESITGGYLIVGSAGSVAVATAISGDVTINSSGVTAIGAGKITPTMLATTVKLETLVFTVSFETGWTGSTNRIVVPFAFTMTSISYNVTKALAATDAGTITPNINGVGVTGGDISLPASTVQNTNTIKTPSALNIGTAGQYIEFVSAKGTAGGECKVTVTLQRN